MHHCSNLVGMGVLPLEFLPGEAGSRWASPARESDVLDLPAKIPPRSTLKVVATAADGKRTEFLACA